jgi:hypothetical protein
MANWTRMTRIGRIYTDFPLSVRIRCIRAIRVPSRFIISLQNLLIGFNTKRFYTAVFLQSNYLMIEMPHSREHKRHAQPVSRCNNFLIPYRASGRYDIPDMIFG